MPADKHESSRLAIACDGFFADEKVTYVKDLIRFPNSKIDSEFITCPYSDQVPTEAMLKLAIQSSKYSRFRSDPNFPKNLCDKLFTTWIARSVSKEIAWEVLVVKQNNNILGLITLSDQDGFGNIGLVAVAEQAHGKGIGRILVTDADRHLANRGYKHAQVVTQRRNLIACRLYESCGYKINKIENIFHFWL